MRATEKLKMKYNKYVVPAVIVLLLVVIAIGFVLKSKIIGNQSADQERSSLARPQKDLFTFYTQWLADTKSTTTSPYDSRLLNSTFLDSEVKFQIERAHAKYNEGDIDPVLCTPFRPKNVETNVIFNKDGKAVIVVTPRGQKVKTEHQAIVGLTIVDSKWQITKIDCSIGEAGPVKEFDFEHTGSLLKEGIEAPHNNQNWHLIYEQEAQPGYVLPLTFNAESVCVSLEGAEGPCDPTLLKETTKVFIQAGMTETGAIVKRLTLI
jgi:hypothetical protein